MPTWEIVLRVGQVEAATMQIKASLVTKVPADDVNAIIADGMVMVFDSDTWIETVKRIS